MCARGPQKVAWFYLWVTDLHLCFNNNLFILGEDIYLGSRHTQTAFCFILVCFWLFGFAFWCWGLLSCCLRDHAVLKIKPEISYMQSLSFNLTGSFEWIFWVNHYRNISVGGAVAPSGAQGHGRIFQGLRHIPSPTLPPTGHSLQYFPSFMVQASHDAL